MKIHALDASGSFYTVRQKATMALRQAASDGDLVVTFSNFVGKARRWGDIKAERDIFWPEPFVNGKMETIFEWMEGRFLSCHDTLVVYSDFWEPSMPTEDTFYRTEFVIVGEYRGQRFFNENLYIVGDFEENYRVRLLVK